MRHQTIAVIVRGRRLTAATLFAQPAAAVPGEQSCSSSRATLDDAERGLGMRTVPLLVDSRYYYAPPW